MSFLKKRKKKITVNGSTLTYSYEELIGRRCYAVPTDEAKLYYRDKCVLITGGGGSIGSEIAREIAECSPRKIIILDINENGAYEIYGELKRRFGDALDVVIEIGSIRDKDRLNIAFALHRPEIVFHAAAHKHVPLMEHNATEAVKNNCIGTYNIINTAEQYKAEKFILISTDKAVNPTNVMGASKRVCEILVKSKKDSRTVFSSVRFGNVLGSSGSVVPLFKRQIEEGGPITLTDKRALRYFMTIPEAAGLVLEAGVKAKGGELFVLDIGEPVRIYDLAVKMIELSGLIPDKDIRIVETGLRPGEKLYEEMLSPSEKAHRLSGDMIFVEEDDTVTSEKADSIIKRLTEAVNESEANIDNAPVIEALKEVVETYRFSSNVILKDT